MNEEIIALTVPSLRKEIQEQFDAIEPGTIRSEIRKILEDKGYKVEEIDSTFILNESVELNYSDELIKSLTLFHLLKPIDLSKIIEDQYGDLIGDFWEN